MPNVAKVGFPTFFSTKKTGRPRRVEKEVRRLKSLLNGRDIKKYFPIQAFYNYEIRDKKEFVCYKKIPAKYIRQIPFPEEPQ